MIAPHGACRPHRRFKLTCEDYDRLRERANDRCEIDTCRAAIVGTGRRPLQIDHDHDLGDWYVRGLLCCRCNVTLAHIAAGRGTPRPEHLRYLAEPWHATNPPPTQHVWTAAERAEREALLDALRAHTAWLTAPIGSPMPYVPDLRRDELVVRALALGASRSRTSMAAKISEARVKALTP